MRIKTSVDLFRWALSVYMMIYYARFLSSLDFYFGANGMVERKYLVWKPSLLLLFPQNWVLYLCYGLIFLFAGLLAVGRLNAIGALILFCLNLSFHNANPFIIHEPQQISSLFLVCFVFFLPRKAGEEADPIVVNTLIAALGVYYFLAGGKKLPDPIWQDGMAVGKLLSWGAVQQTEWARAVLQYPWLNRLLTYGTLFFELTFIFAAFTRWRFVWLGLGLLLHLMIHFTIDVGTFAEIMIVWYALLWQLPNKAVKLA